MAVACGAFALVVGCGEDSGGDQERDIQEKNASLDGRGNHLTERILAAIPSAKEGEFSTPESALEFYVRCLKKGDLASMAKVLAIKERVTHWNFKKYAIDVQSVSLRHGGTGYSHAKFLSAFDHLFTDFHDRVIWNLTTDISFDHHIEINDDLSFEKIFGVTRNPDLSSLEHVVSASEIPDVEAHRRNCLRRIEIHGADDYKWHHLTLKSFEYETSFEVVLYKFGSNWKLVRRFY